MNQLNKMIKDDIEKCNVLIEKGYATYDEVLCFVSKYRKMDPNFGKNLHNYVRTLNDSINYIKNIIIIKNELEALLVINYSKIPSQDKKTNIDNFSPTFNFNIDNSSNNNNSNTNTINITFEDIKDKIKEDSNIVDNEKKEILNKLDEIKKIQLSSLEQKEKWKKIKAILVFLLDKGVDFVITYLPQILLILKAGGILNG